jgi:GR25 family glycosyltransferase involved in LPS biosynthesis
MSTPTPSKKIISYVINMKRNPERFASFTRKFFNSDLDSLIRIEAIDGKQITINGVVSDDALKEIESAERVGFRLKHYQLTRGAVGCYLSHMKAYQTFLASENYDIALIFEDDAIVTPHLKKRILSALDALPDNWDLALLGCNCRSCVLANSEWNRVSRFWGLYACAVNRKGAQKILDLLMSVKKIYQQLDSQLSDYARENKLAVYCYHDKLVNVNRNFETTIQLPVKLVDGIDINQYATPRTGED